MNQKQLVLVFFFVTKVAPVAQRKYLDKLLPEQPDRYYVLVPKALGYLRRQYTVLELLLSHERVKYSKNFLLLQQFGDLAFRQPVFFMHPNRRRVNDRQFLDLADRLLSSSRLFIEQF